MRKLTTQAICFFVVIGIMLVLALIVNRPMQTTAEPHTYDPKTVQEAGRHWDEHKPLTDAENEELAKMIIEQRRNAKK